MKMAQSMPPMQMQEEVSSKTIAAVMKIKSSTFTTPTPRSPLPHHTVEHVEVSIYLSAWIISHRTGFLLTFLRKSRAQIFDLGQFAFVHPPFFIPSKRKCCS
jgi:hypothetical protein